MSDRISDISRCYRDAFDEDHHARSIGLFKIPEYPEYERGDGGMWSSALDAIFTALRYIAPATLLTLFWGQQSFLFRILKHIDLAFRTIVFSSDQQKESVLKWLETAGPVRVEHLDTVWRHGWILCGVLDTAMPGACAGHPPVRMSLKHAQTIADHYLGVDPVFTREELDNSDCLNRHQEWKLAHYLERIREALTKIPPPVSKPNSQRTSPDGSQFTLDYVARGGGLIAAQINNKMFFNVYPTSQQSLEPGDITILIKGPKDTYGMIVIPPILGKAQLIRQKMLKLNKDRQYTENTLPITQGATYFRTYGRNDLKKAYFIPKTKYDIEIEVDRRPEHARIGYIVNLEGRHEISISSRGQYIVGSPFMVTASHNIVGTLAKDSFSLEDGEEIGIVDEDGDKKVVLRVVDFVTEKMLLNDAGPIDQITTNDPKLLSDNKHVTTQTKTDFKGPIKICDTADKDILKRNKLKKTAMKVRAMTRACKIFQSNLAETKLKDKNKESQVKRNQLGIPDVVNSTFSDTYYKSYDNTDIRDSKVPILAEIPIEKKADKPKLLNKFHEKLELLSSPEEKEITSSAVNFTELSTSNPFLNKVEERILYPERVSDLHFTTHNYVEDSDEEDDLPIKITIDKEDTPTNVSPNTNPFIDTDIVERPKTPVLKILNGEIKDRGLSVYIDPDTERITEEILENNEFINPFFMHQHHQDNQETVTDFIIGAPVSLPPIVRAPTPEPALDSLMITCEQFLYSAAVKTDDIPESVFSTPTHTNLENSMTSSTFHSLDSNLDNIESNANEHIYPNIIRDQTPKRDTWDSAYVSIDETNSSPDGNNNDLAAYDKINIEEINLKPEDFSNLGPAEIEMWESCCYELNDDITKENDDSRSSKWEYKRPIFTPIIEESDRSMSAGLKELHESESQQNEQDPVTVAFAELKEVFHEYLSSSEQSSLNTFQEDMSMKSTETNYNVVRSDHCVDSASEHASDVMRQTNTNMKGAISEVQSNAAESFSVSQSLQAKPDIAKAIVKIHFGDDPLTNIVLEKKHFWDEKIRQIEEIKSEQRKKKLSSKHLRHSDSLNRRRGRQLVKSNKVAENSYERAANRSPDEKTSPDLEEPDITDEMHADGKLVQNWKRYWDQRLEELEETQVTCFRAKSPKSQDRYQLPSPVKLEEIKEDTPVDTTINDRRLKTFPEPVKQEVPEEIMFKAFEESPKRFFGTSRKQILNKIDVFLGKPSTADEDISLETSGAKLESGIVSSRISLFHNISNTEEDWHSKKSNSMLSIRARSDSESSKTFQHEIKSLNSHGKIQSNIDLSAENRYSPERKNAVQIKNEEGAENNESPVLKCDKKQIQISTNVKGTENPGSTTKIKQKTSDESLFSVQTHKVLPVPHEDNIVKKTISQINRQSSMKYQPSKSNLLKKSSVSKSEMDIFSKINTSKDNDDLDKYKSYDELPKINVKDFISLYETVSKTTHAEPKPMLRRLSTTNSATSEKLIQSFSSIPGAESKAEFTVHNPRVEGAGMPVQKVNIDEDAPKAPPRHRRSKTSSQESLDTRQSMESINEDKHAKCIKDVNFEEETNFPSISDIEVEIIDKTPDLPAKPTQEVDFDKDYKSRFKLAKQYFQSLEELRPEDKKLTINECEELLMKCNAPAVKNNETADTKSDEAVIYPADLEKTERPNRRIKKNIKALSLPSTELSKLWDQITETEPNKLVKISEKFYVDDLFNDVVEGKLSRQGSLRGIPNKKAVLETFRSMENVSDTKISSYEIAIDQLTVFAKENKIKNAQTYLTEYPFLPTTDPSKYHSRLDTKASGLISMKELKDSRPRRNSVPELVLNPKFSVDL